MSDQNTAPEESKQAMSVVNSIVQHLRDHPFLLITIAGLVVLSGVMVVDLDKLREFKWLFLGVVLIPVFMQFLLVLTRERAKHQLEQARLNAQHAPRARGDAGAQRAAVSGFATKSWWSMGLGVFALLGAASLDEFQWLDTDILAGLLFVSAVGVGLGIWAIVDTMRKPLKGRGIAITGVLLSGLVLLATLGYLNEL